MAARIGLTGGIGSGKSTVLQMLADLGAAVIDADAISRSTTAAGGAASTAIAANRIAARMRNTSPRRTSPERIRRCGSSPTYMRITSRMTR